MMMLCTYQTLFVKSNQWQYSKLNKEKKYIFFYRVFIIWIIALNYTIFLMKLLLQSPFVCSHQFSTVNQVLPGLIFFGVFDITVYEKHWSILLQRCFDGSEFLVAWMVLNPHYVWFHQCNVNDKNSFLLHRN